MIELTSKKRQFLKSQAHHLKPTVQIGEKGLTASVLDEIELNLNAHSLIKITIASNDRDTRDQFQTSICEKLNCLCVSAIGKTFILYRPVQGIDLFSDFNVDNRIQTRAVRQAGEVHTPKKMAAAGRKLDKPLKRTRKTRKVTNNRTNQAIGVQALADMREDGRPLRPSTRRSLGARGQVGRGTRKTGSAMTLRAGRRR